MASALWIIRVIVLALSLLIALGILALGAFYVSKYSTFNIPGVFSAPTPAWAALAIASAAIHIVIIAPAIIVDFVRKGAFTSWIVTEIIGTFIISVLWLADAADATAINNFKILAEFGLPQTCAGADELADAIDALEATEPLVYGKLKAIDFDALGTLCRQHETIQGLAFIAWILLMAYSVTLLIIAIVASVRGVPKVWTGTVRDTNLFASGNAEKAMEKVQFAQATLVSTTAAIGTPSSGSAVYQAHYAQPQQAPVPHPGPYAGQV